MRNVVQFNRNSKFINLFIRSFNSFDLNYEFEKRSQQFY